MSVAPQVRPLPDPELVQRFAGFAVRSRLPLEGGFSGTHRGLHRGAGMEFAEYRRYAPGDDVTRLDWRVLGRSDRLYVKESEADTDLVTRLVLDASGSMGYGSGAGSKLEAACQVAAVLTVLLLQQGDGVGLTGVGGTPATEIAPRRAPAQAGVVCHALRQLQAAGEVDLATALEGLAPRLRRRGLILVFSDAFGAADRLASRLGLLARHGHDVTLFEVTDPDEETFPFAGTGRFEDLEGGPACTVDAGALAPAYRRCLEAHRQQLRAACAEQGVRLLPLRTDEGAAATLSRFLGAGRRPGARGGSP